MTLDLAVIVFLCIVVLSRMRRGFAYSIEELIGVAATVGVALYGYPLLAGVAGKSIGRPPQELQLVAFGFLLLVTQGVYRLFAILLDSAYSRFRGDRGRHRIAAAAPALCTGLLTAALLLTTASSLIAAPGFRGEVKASVVSRGIIEGFSPLNGRVSDLGRSALVNMKLLSTDAGEALAGRDALAGQIRVDESGEDQLLALVNRERVQRGLTPLSRRLELKTVARAHSRDMATERFFDHTSPTQGGLVERLAHFNVKYGVAGENLAIAVDVETAHEALMKSPDHRENLLRPEYRQAGIGIIDGGDAGITITEEFSD